MPRKKVPVPLDVQAEVKRLYGDVERLERDLQAARDKLLDYITDQHNLDNGSYASFSELLPRTKGSVGANVKRRVDDRAAVKKARLARRR